MSRFEDNLWNSVVDEHGDELARHDGAGGQPPRGGGHTRLVAGATLGVVTAAAAIAVVVGAGAASPSPAYAVTLSHNGRVSVRVDNRSGIAAANRRLARMGVNRRVHAVTHGQSVAVGWALPASGCWMYESGKPPVTVQLSAAQQQSEIHDGIWTDPYSGSANNTGGPPQNGPWHVIYCQTGSGGSGGAGGTGAVAPLHPARHVTASTRRDSGSGSAADQQWALPASGCWMYEPGKPPVTVQLSAAQQQADIHDGIYTPPASAGNTGGPSQNGPWHVIYCRTSSGSGSGSSGTA